MEEKKEEKTSAKKEREDKLDKKEREDWEIRAEEYLNAWKRCAADFENYRKRQAETQKEMMQYMNLSLILEMLPVIDNFRASTEHIPAEQKDGPWVTGIMHIQKQLEQILENNGVKKIEAKPGDKFDPEVHEALENKDCEPEKCKNIVKEVITRGYRMGDRIIRPTRVVVE